MTEWTTACPDWERRLVAGESIIPPPIFQDQAEEALAIFKQLRIVDLPGKPTFGECSEPWVFDFVAAVFGAYDADRGVQLIREFYLLIAKKNIKSTLAAGAMLTTLILCWRDNEEHLIIAPTKEVADNSFKPAAGMVRADPELSAIFLVQDHLRTITHRQTNATLKVVAADTDTVSGKKAGRILVDEHWLFGSRANAESMFMEATGGQISREEGWVIYLSTQSDTAPAGVFKAKLDYYRAVRDGRIHDPRSLGVLYEFPKAMIESKAYMKPENFYIANPNIGRSVSADWLARELVKVENQRGGGLQIFLAKHLNIEIGLNLAADRWTGADYWMEQADRRVTLDYILAECEVVDVGIDGGGLDDLLGLAVAGRRRGGGDWLLWCKAWAHPSVMRRRPEIAPRLMDFAKDGDLVVVERIGQDIAQVAAIAARVRETGLLDKVGVDPAGLGGILDALEAVEIPAEQVVGVSQGWKLSGAVKTAERRLAAGTLVHGGQPLMAWSVGNAKIVQVSNAVSITKQASGTAKIDPLMAAFNAVTLMALNPAAMGGSFWDVA